MLLGLQRVRGQQLPLWARAHVPVANEQSRAFSETLTRPENERMIAARVTVPVWTL
jgi:hypothetical protein